MDFLIGLMIRTLELLIVVTALVLVVPVYPALLISKFVERKINNHEKYATERNPTKAP